MGKKLRIALVLVFAVCLGAIIWQMLTPSVPDPMYKGKPLSYWLTGYSPDDDADGKNPPPSLVESREAVQQVGTNAIPMLLAILQEPDQSLKERLFSVVAKQHIVKIRPPVPTLIKKNRASKALVHLGTNAAFAVPQLMEIYKQHTSLISDQIVCGILSKLGPSAYAAIPFLTDATTNNDAWVRMNSVYTLGRIRSEPDMVVPVLIRCLQDSFSDVQVNAMWALEAYGDDARAAVPVMLELLKVEKVKSLGQTFQDVRAGWAFGERPVPVATDADVVEIIEQALKAIDPDAAAKAGIK